MPMYLSAKPFPVAEELGATGINLPTYSTLTGEQVRYISGKILSFYRERR
jgi:dTDP-4-amino-4,6-dideoxygalactose transaminase